MLEELASLNVFHYEVNIRLSHHDFLEPNDVGVLDQSHNRYFSFNLYHHPTLKVFFFVQVFNGNALTGLDVSCVVALANKPFPSKFPTSYL